MSGIVIEIKLPADLLLALDNLTQAANRLAAAIEAKGSPVHVHLPAAENPAEAAEPEPAPTEAPVEAPAPTASDYLTAARRALLEAEYPAGVHINGILQRFNAMHGPAVRDPQQLALLANSMKLRRPPRFHSPSAPMTLAEVEAAKRTVPVAPPAPPKAAPVPARDVPAGQMWADTGHRRSSETVAPQPVPKAAAPQPAGRMDALRQVAASIPSRAAGARSWEPVDADFDQIKTWAGQRGVAFGTWDDLPAVNRKREQLGVPPFRRKLLGRTPHRPEPVS